MHGELGEIRLTRDVAGWVQEQMQMVYQGNRRMADLERFGRQLFDKVLPEQVRQLYWRMRDLKLWMQSRALSMRALARSGKGAYF